MNETKTTELRRILGEMQRVIVAYSGGVDSTLLAFLANTELGNNALALTAVSPSLSWADLQEAQTIARRFSFAHQLITAHELQNENYQANTPLRCYWCKNEVYGLLTRYAKEHSFACVIDGTNLDDIHDRRPGRQAASEYGVRSPFIEAQITKGDIRLMAREFGLPNWNKPAAACLASRIPYGTPITEKLLSQVERAEMLLRSFGIRQARVRHHGDIARLEVNPDSFELTLALREQIVEAFQALGFTFTVLDLAGYKTGSLNQLVKVTHES